MKPAEIASLDQARAWCDDELTINIRQFRAMSAECGADEVLMRAVIELSAWSSRQLAGMLAVAIARLAQAEQR